MHILCVFTKKLTKWPTPMVMNFKKIKGQARFRKFDDIGLLTVAQKDKQND